MKKILLLLLLILLSSCSIPFLGSDETTESANTNSTATGGITEYKDNSISISIPKTWLEIEKLELPSPKTGTIVLALKSNDLVDSISRNLIILKDEIIGNITSEQYSRNDYLVSIKKYSGHKEIESKTISYTDGTNSMLYSFEAMYNPDSPIIKFLQTSKICSKNSKSFVYNITIALPPSINDLEKYEELIKSFKCLD